MEIHKVAKAMIPIVQRTDLSGVPGCCCKAHLKNMLIKIISGDVTDKKAHRWLGYVQGVVVFRAGATLEELKNLNR